MSGCALHIHTLLYCPLSRRTCKAIILKTQRPRWSQSAAEAKRSAPLFSRN